MTATVNAALREPDLAAEDFIPPFLQHRPSDAPLDHIALARASYSAQADAASAALKIVDLRMEEAEETIARLRRQLADDRREAAAQELVLNAARGALARLDGVDR